jgi:hypothetical protein
VYNPPHEYAQPTTESQTAKTAEKVFEIAGEGDEPAANRRAGQTLPNHAASSMEYHLPPVIVLKT